MTDNRIVLDTRMSQRIRKNRENADLSQSALAKKARVPRARIKRIECNELATIDSREYERISKALGIPTLLKAKKTSKKKKTPKQRRRSYLQKQTPTRRAMMRLLDEAGVLDMTLRELLT